MKTFDIAFVGAKGSGKTLCMSYLGHIFSKTLNINLFANYHLRGAVKINNLNELYNVKNGIFCFTEAHQLLDSRQFYKKENIEITHWYLMTRKFKINFFYDTQDYSQVDSRIRQNTDYIVLCHEKQNSFYYVMITQSGNLVRCFSLSKNVFTTNLYDTNEIIRAFK